MTGVAVNRLTLTDRTNLAQLNSGPRFVSAWEFLELARSTRKLVRADERAAGLRGLLDQETGETFVISEDRLDESLRTIHHDPAEMSLA